MKNKKRLAVIAMSALMALTSVPYAAFASDFSDGSEAVAESVEEFSDDAEQVGDTTDFYAVTSVAWSASEAKDGTISGKLTYTTSDNKSHDVDTTYIETELNSDGTTAYTKDGATGHYKRARFYATVDKVNVSSSLGIDHKDVDNKTILYSNWVKVGDTVDHTFGGTTTDYNTHFKAGQLKKTCTACGYTETSSISTLPALGHDEKYLKDVLFVPASWIKTTNIETTSTPITVTSTSELVEWVKDNSYLSYTGVSSGSIGFSDTVAGYGTDSITLYLVQTKDGVPVLKKDQYSGVYISAQYCEKDGAIVNAVAKSVNEESAEKSKVRITFDADTSVSNIVGVWVDATGTGTKSYYTASTIATLDIPYSRLSTIKDSDFVMANCGKNGTYTVTLYGADDGKGSSYNKTITAPNHFDPYKVAVFAEGDAEKCTVTYGKNSDGTTNKMDLVVKSMSCYEDVKYTEVTLCSNDTYCNKSKYTTSSTTLEVKDPAGTITSIDTLKTKHVIESKTATAAHSGEHTYVYNAGAKADVAKAVETYKTGHALWNELKSIVSKYNTKQPGGIAKGTWMALSDYPTDCTKGGTVTITYYCLVCKSEKMTQTVTIPADSHEKASTYAAENKVEPTCSKRGSYDQVQYCAYCKTEMGRTTKYITRLAHTNETGISVNGTATDDTTYTIHTNVPYVKLLGDKVVDYNGKLLTLKDAKDKTIYSSTVSKYTSMSGNYVMIGGQIYGDDITITKPEYGVVLKVATNCATCKDHEVILDTTKITNYTITLVDITKESGKGEAGSITFKVSYTVPGGKSYSQTETVPYYSEIENYTSRTEAAKLNGLNQDADGVYRYYKDNAVDTTKTGIVEYAGGKFFVASGVLCSGANGLNKNAADGEWYFLSNGQVQTQFTGLASYNGAWFYIVNGKLDKGVTGIVPYNGGYFAFAEGRLLKETSGLWRDATDGTWYYLSHGQVQTYYTGVVAYNGAYFYVTSGELDKTYTGTVTYLGKTYKVVSGQCY